MYFHVRKMINMKNNKIVSVTVSLLVVLLFTACATSKVAAPDGSGNVNLKGTWTVQDISFEGISKNGFKVTVFDDAPYSCFIGSQWNLIASGNGSYTIPSSTGCAAGERTIFWGVQTENGTPVFLFKKLPPGAKPQKITDGFKMTVKSVTANTMILQDDINFEGKTIYINYHFSR
jgi:hypothetical protein